MLHKGLLNEIHIASGILTAGRRWKAKKNMRNDEVKWFRSFRAIREPGSRS